VASSNGVINKFVAYYRVSTDRQGRSGLGLDAQRETVRQFLAGTGGYPPIEEYLETESGRKTDRQRPELARALAACRAHRAVLVIAKMDRLARNQAFLMSLVDSKVDVRFCDLPDIPAGALGRFMLQQMAAVAELEAGLISERTRAALAAKVARDGQWDRRAKHHLVPGAGQAAATDAAKARAAQAADDLAPILAEITSSGATSLRQIADQMNRRGIPTARGGRWAAPAVRNLIQRIGPVEPRCNLQGRAPPMPSLNRLREWSGASTNGTLSIACS
jgi:DNA invertase Pin-like site-specific DNA recombinase